MCRNRIIKGVLYTVIVTGAFIPVFSFVLIGIMIGFLILFKKENEILEILKNKPILLLLILTMFISAIFSELWFISIFFVLFFVIKIIFCAATALYFNDEDIIKLITIILIVGLIVSLIGIFQAFTEDLTPKCWVDGNLFDIKIRVYSTFYNPNVLAVFLNLVIISGIVVMENYKEKLLFNLAISSSLASFICLLATYSRGGWISLFLAILVLSLFNNKYLKYFIVLALAIILFDYIYGIGRLSLIKVLNDSSIHYRLYIWSASIKIFKDYMLMGVGPGVLWDFIPRYSSIIKSYVAHAHNLYLQVMLETGLFGFIIFIYSIQTIWNKIKLDFNNQGIHCTISVITFAFFISLLVHGFIDAVPLQPQISIYIWLLIGICFMKKGIIE